MKKKLIISFDRSQIITREPLGKEHYNVDGIHCVITSDAELYKHLATGNRAIAVAELAEWSGTNDAPKIHQSVANMLIETIIGTYRQQQHMCRQNLPTRKEVEDAKIRHWQKEANRRFKPKKADQVKQSRGKDKWKQ